MNKRIKLIVGLFLLAIVFLVCRFALLILIESKLESLSVYYSQVNEVNLVLSDQRGDGSEYLIENLPTQIKPEVERLVTYLKIYSGRQSRVYIYITKEAKGPIVLEIETSRQWRESFMFYYRVNWLFCDDEVYLSQLAHSSKYSFLYGRLLKAI